MTGHGHLLDWFLNSKYLAWVAACNSMAIFEKFGIDWRFVRELRIDFIASVELFTNFTFALHLRNM